MAIRLEGGGVKALMAWPVAISGGTHFSFLYIKSTVDKNPGFKKRKWGFGAFYGYRCFYLVFRIFCIYKKKNSLLYYYKQKCKFLSLGLKLCRIQLVLLFRPSFLMSTRRQLRRKSSSKRMIRWKIVKWILN